MSRHSFVGFAAATVSLLSVIALAQRPTGAITGRIVTEDGQPLINAVVTLIGARRTQQPISGRGAIVTDEEGNFQADGLDPMPYEIRIWAPGYIPSPNSKASDVLGEFGQNYSYIGDSVTITMIKGGVITGKVVNAAASENLVGSINIPQFADQGGYAVYGLPNGEYELVAFREDRNSENSFASSPKRATINGRDVAGVDLVLAPTASISGSVVIEKNQLESGKCESKRSYYLDEIAIKAGRDEPDEKAPERDMSLSIYRGRPVGTPNDQGGFSIRSLKPGRYRIEAQLPDENWYVKAMTMPTNDVGRNGLTLKSGEQASGLSVAIANGAAGLKGRIAAGEGVKLASRLRVHLIPAEIEAKDDPLRFAEAKAESDGSFSFTNFAPGKYLMIARSLTENEASDALARPVAWGNIERAKLRKEAEAAKLMVELKACQRIGDYILRFAK